MNRKLKSYIRCVITVAMLTLAMCFQSFAATARIAFSDPSTQAGEEFSVTMKFTCTSGDALGNTDVMLGYDSDTLEFIPEGNASGGSGAIRVTSGVTDASEVTTTLRFRALRAGTTQITVQSWEGYDTDGQTLTMEREGSSTITIAAPANETYSTDASLQSLQVSPGTLDPAFSTDVENYTVSVGLDTTDIRVSAVPTDANAQVTLQGDTQLQEGANTVVCTVTAQDGTTVRNYTITVNKVEGGESASDVPEETAAAVNLEVLAQLEASKTPFKLGITAVPEGVSAPAGLKESTITIGDAQVQGWAPETDGQPEYCVFYGVSESGVPGFYSYDMTDRTIQRYFAAENTQDEEYLTVADRYDNLVDDYRIARGVAIGGIVAAIALLIALLILIFGRGKKPASYQEKYEPDRAQTRKKESRTPRSLADKKLSKEEKYMLGVEDEYAEEEVPEDDMLTDDMLEDDMLEDDIPEEEIPERIHSVVVDSAAIQDQVIPEEILQEQVAPVEKEIEKKLADVAATAVGASEVVEEDDDDDFEIFDLDDDDDK